MLSRCHRGLSSKKLGCLEVLLCGCDTPMDLGKRGMALPVVGRVRVKESHRHRACDRRQMSRTTNLLPRIYIHFTLRDRKTYRGFTRCSVTTLGLQSSLKPTLISIATRRQNITLSATQPAHLRLTYTSRSTTSLLTACFSLHVPARHCDHS